LSEINENKIDRTPPNCLTPNCHYEKMAEMAGGQGFYCENLDQLKSALEKAIQVLILRLKISPKYPQMSISSITSFHKFQEKEKPTIINVMINTAAQRKQQDFDWLTRAKL
jgi:hypothetical protein